MRRWQLVTKAMQNGTHGTLQIRGKTVFRFLVSSDATTNVPYDVQVSYRCEHQRHSFLICMKLDLILRCDPRQYDTEINIIRFWLNLVSVMRL